MAAKKKVVEEKEKKMCTSCGKNLVVNGSVGNFYISNSSVYKHDRKMPICKKCVCTIFEEYLIETRDDKKAVFQMCRLLDTVFLEELVESAAKEAKKINSNVMKTYMKTVNSLSQYRGMTFKDSKYLDENEMARDYIPASESVTPQLVEKWGMEYTNEQIAFLEKTYNEFMNEKTVSYDTSTHYVKLACIWYLRSLEAGSKGKSTKDSKDYTDMFSKMMKEAELAPSILAKKANAKSIGNISEFAKMVEETVNIIDLRDILPEYFEQPQDNVDRVMWFVINYMEKTLGRPLSTYEQVYEFYEVLAQEKDSFKNNKASGMDDKDLYSLEDTDYKDEEEENMPESNIDEEGDLNDILSE